MPATGRLHFAPPGADLADAKSTCRRAYSRARKAGGMSTVVIDSLWADTLLAIDGQPAEAASEMLRRTAHIFVLIEDRARWPRG
jgi:hypothetical protein